MYTNISGVKQKLYIMKKLSLRDSKKLVWITWCEFMIVAMIVYLFTNPVRTPLFLACPIVLYALINFWVKSDKIPVRLYSVVPAVFLPTAFLTVCGAIIGIISDQKFNSLTLALITLCVLCTMVIHPESSYVDKDWSYSLIRKSVALLCGGFKKKFFYIYNSS